MDVEVGFTVLFACHKAPGVQHTTVDRCGVLLLVYLRGRFLGSPHYGLRLVCPSVCLSNQYRCQACHSLFLSRFTSDPSHRKKQKLIIMSVKTAVN